MLNQQTVPNVIQGVSQQAAQARRPTQCKEQFDCLNHAVEGAGGGGDVAFARDVDVNDRAGFTMFYMRVWQLFFLEYAIVSIACLAG